MTSSSSSGVGTVDENFTRVEKDQVNSIEEKLKQYEEQLTQVTNLLEQSPQANPSLEKLKNQINEAIEATNQLLQDAKSKLQTKIEDNLLPGSICEAKYEDDGSWYTVRVDDVLPEIDEDDEKKWQVTFIGYGNTIECTSENLRPFRPPNPDALVPGDTCYAVYSDNGMFYEAVIDKPTDKGTVWVTFKKYNTAEEVPLTHLRLTVNKKLRMRKRAEETGKQQVADEQRQKKKAKQEKRKKRQQEQEQERESNKQNWQQFSAKLGRMGKKAGMFNSKKRESAFRSPMGPEGRVGVLNSGKAMTPDSKYTPLSLARN
eukprot:TRINITY_DN67169_c4_g2_i1.p1 TRINITY_DN67169_c4_g2~~TRINITY_DN67169_c4_g2_i1.p1  ORF type:complete len:329 (+),score=52.13 TRINITY_DN67169_c4_g2_i1:42-989(+)